jgi:hypothetical protein
MKTETNKLAELESQIAATKQKLSQLKALQRKNMELRKKEEQEAARKADTRRKILVGAFLLERMHRDARLAAETLAQLDNYLTRDDERSLFGFSALRPEQQPASSENMAAAQ